ncbi:MAG: nucleotide exchange factor GrpE [Candidatus Delongbacteria bacterium]
MKKRSDKHKNNDPASDQNEQAFSEKEPVREMRDDSDTNKDIEKNISSDDIQRQEELEKEILEYRDKLIRKAAEFENYKKRTSEEFIRLINSATEDIVFKLLPVLDDIDRFEKNYSDDSKAADLKKGVDMIFNKLRSILQNAGLNEINSIDQEFDPDFHDALLMTEKEGVEPNIVIDEHEKGYKLNDKVIRHAKVIVSK